MTSFATEVFHWIEMMCLAPSSTRFNYCRLFLPLRIRFLSLLHIGRFWEMKCESQISQIPSRVLSIISFILLLPACVSLLPWMCIRIPFCPVKSLCLLPSFLLIIFLSLSNSNSIITAASMQRKQDRHHHHHLHLP